VRLQEIAGISGNARKCILRILDALKQHYFMVAVFSVYLASKTTSKYESSSARGYLGYRCTKMKVLIQHRNKLPTSLFLLLFCSSEHSVENEDKAYTFKQSVLLIY
jgi:hypothetical protein